MKSIQLKTFQLAITGMSPVTISYRREFLNMLEVIPEGLTIAQMGDMIKIIDKLRALTDEDILRLEPTEWEALKTRVTQAKFSFVSADLVAMVNAVLEAADA